MSLLRCVISLTQTSQISVLNAKNNKGTYIYISLPGHYTKMIDICLVLARRLVAFYRKNIEGPSTDHWLEDLSHFFFALERITNSIKGKIKRLP